MTTPDQSVAWADTLHLVEELWPKFEPSPAVAKLWKQRLGVLNQAWLQEAVRRVYWAASNGSARRREPCHVAIEAAFREVQREHAAASAAVQEQEPREKQSDPELERDRRRGFAESLAQLRRIKRESPERLTEARLRAAKRTSIQTILPRGFSPYASISNPKQWSWMFREAVLVEIERLRTAPAEQQPARLRLGA